MDRECNFCNKKLVSNMYFCNEECENNFRNKTKELYVLSKDGLYDWICPVEEFKETEDELICHNGRYEFRFNKNEVDKWKIDQCSCLQEFTTIDTTIN